MMKTTLKLSNEMKEYLKMKNQKYIEKCINSNKNTTCNIWQKLKILDVLKNCQD